MKVLRVDAATGQVQAQALPPQYEGWSNRGLIAKILDEEVPATCNPLEKRNKLIFATGVLAGLGVSSAERLSVGAKSPLTGGVRESNAGGVAARALVRHGIRAVVVENKAEKGNWWLLRIGRDGCEILPAGDLKGLGNYALVEALRERFGQRIATISIGPAGERLYTSAGVFVTDMNGWPSRAAGRGGLGAVMGSKGLKAIVVSQDGDYRIPIRDQVAFNKARQDFVEALKQSPVTAELYPKYGTAGVIPAMQTVGGLPTRNFTSGNFSEFEEIGGERLHDLIVARGGEGTPTEPCMPGCIIRCSNIVADAQGKAVVAPLEYETIALLGSNLEIGDLDQIALMNRLCNDYGIDTVEIGGAIGVAMEAGLEKFGDADGALRLLREAGEGTILGRVLGQGVVVTARVLGISRVPAVKGQGMPAHEPRALKGMGVTYSMSPMGADHTTAPTIRASIDHHKPDGQVDLVRGLQTTIAAYDSLGFCLFVLPAVGKSPQITVDLLNAVYGTNHEPDYISQLGREILRTERAFNTRAGLTEASELVPEFLREETLPPNNLVFDIPEEEMAKFWDGI
ncbi:MAG: aldehyde ferredoxin oxidoreductase [Chloroflexi bacterium]|nr:aldehyde ferredoxin oxidoreductase [Chloroflexota bacterium]